MRFCLLILMAVLTFATESPQISPELRAKFWRAQAEDIAAQAQAQRTRASMQFVAQEMTKACGDFDLAIGGDGEPICKPKPTPQPAEKAKP